MVTSFSVKAGEFEGPLDLLLTLIEERKFLVSDVSLSQVADDFLSYLRTHVAFPIGQAAHFVVVAATLLLIKSRTLLPALSLTDEEEENVHDLEFRLSVYQIIRNAARGMASLSSSMFFGNGTRIVEPVFTPPKDLSLASIGEAAERALKNAPEISFVERVAVKTVISLEEMIDKLSERIEKAIRLTFRDFSGGATADKYELVVGFLAMLELVKRGLLVAEQPESFGDITMDYGGEVRAPRYE